ncbi:zinc finger CCCH domain-containing protein 11A-like isoform X2 [Pecten maximus]|uniref:zinc finger CCCH domain-containing protein 11A-like isoform X2 n=1 Tax=Pecten maximus TaxID=6579 RepID=UPI001458788C|nr:zinc finger CCCH domain-containing protein 11A-like isoform X2 [Pecten maximus]
MTTSNDDCFYFYTSTCAKGDDCAYRHCEAARNSTMTCVFWKQNKCKSTECPYRHSEMIKPIMQNKAELPCYFETIASGCTRSSCPFKHLKPRPPKVLKASSSSTNIITLVDATQDDGTSQPTPGTLAESDSLKGPVIDPIIVNPAEDSDFDSPFSSPVKSVIQKSASVSNVIDVASRKDLTFQETGKKNDPPSADSGNKIISPSSPKLSGKTSPQLKRAPSETEPSKAVSSSCPSKTVSQVKKTSPSTKSNLKVRKLSVKNGMSGTRPSTAHQTKQPDKRSGTPQQNRARKALATAKERSKHSASHSAQTAEEAKKSTEVKKEVTSIPAEAKVISLKKNSQEKEEEVVEVKTTDEENSDEDLGIKSLEQTLRERALRSMGIIELKSGRIVRTKDQPVKKEEPVKRRKRSSSDDKSKKGKSERNSTEKLPVHKRIGTVKRTPPDRKRSVDERNSQARNKEREERIRRLKLEQERENKRRQIMAAKKKARAQKALEAAVVKKEESEKESASEEEDSEEEEAEESSSDGGNEEVKDEEEELGEEVDIELGEGELEEEEEEEVPVKIVFDTRRAIRKSDSVENFTIKKPVSVEPVKAKVVQEVTIKKTFVVQPKEEKEKPKRKRRVILEDDDPAPLPVFSKRSNISKVEEVKTKVKEVKKPKIEKKPEEKQLKPVVQPMVKAVVSAPKVWATNVWSRRAWDSKPKESGDSADSRPSLGGIRSRLGIPGASSVSSSGDQEMKNKEAEPKLRRRLGWRKTPVVSADDDTDSAKKAVSLAAIRARVGQKLTTGSDEGSTSIQSDSREDVSAASRKYRQPIQIYVPPPKKRPNSVPEDEEPSKKRFTGRDMEGFKEEIKPVKTFVQIMAEKRERQKKLVEEQKNTSSLESSPTKKTYAPVKFAIDETDLADDSTRSRLPKESLSSFPVSNSVPSSSPPSLERSMVTSSNSQSWSFKEQISPLSSQLLHDMPTDSDNLGVSDIDSRLSEKILPQTSTMETAPTIAVQDFSSTQDFIEDSSIGLSEKRDQICVEDFSLPSSKMEPVMAIASDVQQEEKEVSPTKRSSRNDSWLEDIDISDLDDEKSEEETNDDDLLREIDELLA